MNGASICQSLDAIPPTVAKPWPLCKTRD